jgi:hypothetical protein
MAAALLAQRSKTATPDSAGGEHDKLDLLTWTMVYRRMLVPERPLDLAGHRYLVDIYGCRAQKLVLFKASQMGASEYAVSYVLHAADQRMATVLYVFPTDVAVSDFSSARIGPAIEASPYLGSIVVEGGASEGKRGADRVTLKRVRNRFVYLRGAQVDPKGNAKQLKSIDADIIVLDEVDEMDPRAPAIAHKRLGHSRIGEERWISTPTFTGVGVHAEWLKSDQREWFIRCEGCGAWQALTIDHVVEEWDQLGRPVRWHGQGEGQAWAACSECGKPINRMGQGQWVAAYPEREVAGFHLTRLFSPVADFAAIVANLATTDETKRREAYNQDLGLPYTPRGGQMTDELLDKCRREYGYGQIVPRIDPQTRLDTGAAAPVMGVDVGKVLHVVVRQRVASSDRAEWRQVWAGEVESWDELGRTIWRYGVERCVIDAMPETTKAREFQAQWTKDSGKPGGGTVWLAYYVDDSKKVETVTWKEVDGVVSVDRTRAMDEMYARFYSEPPEVTLPAGIRDVRDYYSHMKAPVRVLEEKPNGQRVARYVESGPDHLCHAEVYCSIAGVAPRPAAPVAASAGRAVSRAALGL